MISHGSSRGSATTVSFSKQAATMLATVLHLHRGTPYVYQGEELGILVSGLTLVVETTNGIVVATTYE